MLRGGMQLQMKTLKYSSFSLRTEVITLPKVFLLIHISREASPFLSWLTSRLVEYNNISWRLHIKNDFKFLL